jgi:PhoH-like ATPase
VARTTSSTTTKKASETAKKKPAATPTATKTYVIDTSVLLSDPRALFKFKEQEVVIPILSLIHI